MWLAVMRPRAASATVAATAVRTQKPFGGPGIISSSYPQPPLTKTFDRKFRRIMGYPDVHKTLIPMHIVSPLGNSCPHRQAREVIRVHLSRFAFRTPRPSRILKITHPLFLLGVDRQDWLSLADEISDPCIDGAKLFISVRGSAALFVFGVPLNRVAQGTQFPMHGSLAHRMPLATQLFGNAIRRFTRPLQRTHGIPCRGLFHDLLQGPLQ